MLRKAASYIALFAVLFSACATNPVTGKKELMLISEAQEIEIGRDLYPNALWGAEGGGGEYRDEALNAYLKDIVLRIHSVSQRPGLPVEFAVQNSSVPNAWAIPGYVVITRGLLSALESEAEFVFVMGHEMGHVAARHSARQMTYGMLRQIGLAGAGIALRGKSYSDEALGAGLVGSGLVLLKYSREQELEADGLGVGYMAKLGYDPLAAISAHKRIEAVSGDYLKSLGREPGERGFFEDLLATHPRASIRVSEIEEIIRSSPAGGSATGKEKFLAMTEGTRKVNKSYGDYYDKAARAFEKGDMEAAQKLSLRATEEDGGQPPFWALRGFIGLKKAEYDGALKHFKAALGIDPRYEPALRGLGAVDYFTGRYPEAVRDLTEALSLFPEDVYAHYFLGMSYFKENRCPEALRHLNTYAEADPKHPEIHGVLGVCYERTNDPYSAYDEYLLQTKIAPDSEIGRYASTRLYDLRKTIRKK